MSDINPYAAPSADADAAASGRTLVLSEEVRQLVARTSMLMIVAACIEMASSTIDLILGGEITRVTVVTSMVFLVVPVFVLMAGLSLRRMAAPGDDHAALQIGLRNLWVVFLLKGAALLLVLGFSVLSVLWMFLG